jgi:pilus assembly protein Flp/PilA
MLNNLMAHLAVRFGELKDRDEGQGLIEYALIAVLISVVAIGIMQAVGGSVGDVFTQVNNALTGAE